MGGAVLIADASGLILFAGAGHLDILQGTVEEVRVPGEVHQEVVQAKPDRPDARLVAEAVQEGWVVVEAPDPDVLDRIERRHPRIGRGETAAIALARSLGEESVLIDDHAGRGAAKLEGLRPVGSLGVLAAAVRSGVVADKVEAGRVLRDLLRAGLWVDAAVIEEFWLEIGGRP